MADPNDIGSRWQIVHLDGKEIDQPVVSPDGRQIAFSAAPWKGPWELWLVNTDGTGLRQLLSAAGQVSWSRDGGTLAHNIKTDAEGSALETIDVATGERHRLLTEGLDVALVLLGWSANDQEVYYMRSSSQSPELGSELWAIGRDGLNAHRIASLGDHPGAPVLSPDGSKFLIGTPEGVAWISADGRDQQVITQPTRGFTAIWAPDGQGLVTSQWESNRSDMVVQVMDVTTRSTENLGVVAPIGNWRFLALSPDRQWLAAYHYYSGLHWFHLPTGTAVPVPSEGRVIFAGWIPRPAG